MTVFDDLIARFARNTGLPLKADESNACYLQRDGLLITAILDL